MNGKAGGYKETHTQKRIHKNAFTVTAPCPELHSKKKEGGNVIEHSGSAGE